MTTLAKLVAVLALAGAQSALAQTILDTGLVYPQGQGLGLSRRSGFAAKFTLPEAKTITSLQFALFVYDNNNSFPLLLDYRVYDANLGLPEASQPLFSTTIAVAGPTPIVPFSAQNSDPRTIGIGPTGLSLALGPGQYWLALLSPTSESVRTAVGRTPNADSPDFILKAPDGSLDGPQRWFLGLNSVGSFGVRILAEPGGGGGGGPGAIPEPASWAMLIAGFGLTGAMARRRRTLLRVVAA